MAPTKSTNRAITSQAAMNALLPTARKGLTRRSGAQLQHQNVEIMQTRAKRKAENSPIKNEKVKRSALGNLTNNAKAMTMHFDGLDAKSGSKMKKLTAQQVQALLDAKKMIGNAGVVTVSPTKTEDNVVKSRVLTRAAANRLVGLDLLEDDKRGTNSKVPSLKDDDKKLTAAKFSVYEEEEKEEDDEAIKIQAKTIGDINNILDRCDTSHAVRKTKIIARKTKPTGPPSVPVVVPTAAKTCGKLVRRISNEFNKTEESLYMSALEDISSCESSRYSGTFEAARRRSVQQQLKQKTEKSKDIPEKETNGKLTKVSVPLPQGVEDFDKQNWDDPLQVSHYAMDIFNYMKEREKEFPIDNYLERQPELTKYMRMLLVDWMVEVQETFELNHETLYLGVKIVDIYLCRKTINKEKLQLLGAASLFIACKFDERQPPLVDDFLYICDGAYKHKDIVRMEIETFRTVNYDLGIPISYRFQRRFARCAKVPMPTLTLARYILELALMDYDTVRISDSKLACAALFMGVRMHNFDHTEPVWTPTLKYYSGYDLNDFAEFVPLLNVGLHRNIKTIRTVRSKYSHRIFYEVAKVPLLTVEELFQNNLDLNMSNTSESY